MAKVKSASSREISGLCLWISDLSVRAGSRGERASNRVRPSSPLPPPASLSLLARDVRPVDDVARASAWPRICSRILSMRPPSVESGWTLFSARRGDLTLVLERC